MGNAAPEVNIIALHKYTYVVYAHGAAGATMKLLLFPGQITKRLSVISPDCGTREALESIGVDEKEQELITLYGDLDY